MKDDSNAIEFTAPGFGAKVRGAAWTSREVIVVIVVIACTAFLYLERIPANKAFLDQHANTQAQLMAQSRVTHDMLASVLRVQSDLVKEVKASADIQAYVLSLPQDKRERLNLSMPPELRNRIRQGAQ